MNKNLTFLMLLLLTCLLLNGIKEEPVIIGNPSKSAACWHLGLIYEKHNEPDRAEETYERGLKLDPDDNYCRNALEQLKGD